MPRRAGAAGRRREPARPGPRRPAGSGRGPGLRRTLRGSHRPSSYPTKPPAHQTTRSTKPPQLTYRTFNRDFGLPNCNDDYLAPLLRDELMPVRVLCVCVRSCVCVGGGGGAVCVRGCQWAGAVLGQEEGGGRG